MSKMGNLFTDIQLDLEQDINPLDIARRLNIPVIWVYEVSESIQDSYENVYEPWN